MFLSRGVNWLGLRYLSVYHYVWKNEKSWPELDKRFGKIGFHPYKCDDGWRGVHLVYWPFRYLSFSVFPENAGAACPG